ncbi:DNA-binding protein [Flavobacteriaceae bacterium]|jgi:predicted RNA-binding protein (virulence factor B family)|uniref:DNA-binding protein n=1 Tax=Candidatus Arcticimaribacter forsetii TaxID=2820661 RepID=UPI00234FF42A|nr:DNA-binding protein [Candidatus Arcticimaribacter forsetii]MDC0959959.1 DNA-binding protein [Flavobacteriaceae bacterium]
MEYEIGDRVQLTIQRATDLGYVVMIDDEFEGLLFRNEVFQPLTRYAEVRGYIKNIREDGKIDVSLRPQGFLNVIDVDCDSIMEVLKERGSIMLTDKSSPESIKRELKMSKKAFKKAVGFLYKRKLIVLLDDRIELVKTDQ